MALSDFFNNATVSTRPDAGALTAQKLIAASSITVDTTAGWPVSPDSVHFIIYQVDAGGNKVAGTQTDWKGTVTSSTAIGSLTLKAGTDQIYPVGSKVIATPTGAWADDLVTGLLVSHDQDGTLKAGAVDTTAVLADDVVTGAKIADDTVTNLNHQVAIRPVTLMDETTFDFVASGCVWSGDAYGSTRVASMTAGVVYINGARLAVSAVTSRTFTASRDTYIDVDNTGTVVYTEVTNNNASPALASNSIRIGIIVTGASNIANVGSVNQGQEDKVLPIASSIPYAVTDSLGNLICSRDPQRTTLGLRQRPSNFTTTTVGSNVDVTELSVPFFADGIRKVTVEFICPGFSANAVSAQQMSATILEGGTVIATKLYTSGGANYRGDVNAKRTFIPTAGLHTYKVAVQQGTAGTLTVEGAATYPMQLKVSQA